MAIWLVTGAPGSGKTHYVMKKIKDELKNGRKVYTNIADCKLDVLPIPINEKGQLDWTLTPAGSEQDNEKGALVVYDEAQKLEYFAYKRGEKLSNDKLIKDLETHRHLAYDLIFITQSPKFMHLHLIELVGEHYHVVRRFNKNQSEIHLSRKVEMNPESNAAVERAEDIFTLDYDKKLFESYKSTEMVTNKGFRLSNKIKRSLYIIGGILALLIYLLFFKDGGNKYVEKAVGVESSAQVSKSEQTTNNKEEKKKGFGEQAQEQKEESAEEKLNKELDMQIQLIQKKMQLEQLQAEYAQLQQTKNHVKGMIKNNNHCQIMLNNQIINLTQSECNKYMQRPIIESAPIPVSSATPAPVPAFSVPQVKARAEIVIEDESELLISFADSSVSIGEQEEQVLTSDFTRLNPVLIDESELAQMSVEHELELTLVSEND